MGRNNSENIIRLKKKTAVATAACSATDSKKRPDRVRQIVESRTRLGIFIIIII
jgi:hypothetical protein